MAEIERLVRRYENFVKLPWEMGLAGPQKIWFCLYEPEEERRLRARVGECEVATRRAGHDWRLCDLTGVFSGWMAEHEYRESYFRSPHLLGSALDEFVLHVVATVQDALDADDDTVVALLGAGSLFGLARTSEVIERVAGGIRGRLMVFFPGRRDGHNYRLLDARDGWTYHAIPIESDAPTG